MNTPEKTKTQIKPRKKEPMQTKQSVINSNIRATVIAAFGVLSMVFVVSETAQAQARDDVPPAVFQAAGATAASIQSTVDAFRARLGDPNNLNNPGPLGLKGRREINWDGGNPNVLDTTAPVTPFIVFLNTRGSQFNNTRVGAFAGSSVRRAAGRIGRAVWQPNLRSNLQSLQSLPFVHACGEQHYRSLLLHTGYQWHCPGNSQRFRRGVHRC